MTTPDDALAAIEARAAAPVTAAEIDAHFATEGTAVVTECGGGEYARSSVRITRMEGRDMMQHDTQFEDSTVKSVREEVGQGWSVGSTNGGHLFVGNEEMTTPPAIGEMMRTYGKGLGYPVRGIVIGGRVYRYQSEADSEAARIAAFEESKRQKRAEFESKRESFMERVEALPEGFRDRMRGFLSSSPEWAWECGPYELFCCEEAVKIAATLGSASAVRAFAKSSQAEQKAAVPTMEFEEHSGNTFGSAVRLALMSMENPEVLPKYHAAICPLMGCADAGCWSARSIRDE